MSKMHNLGTVFKFETLRTLKKPTFWLTALGFPLLIGVLYGIMFWSQSTTIEASKNLEKQEFFTGSHGRFEVGKARITGSD